MRRQVETPPTPPSVRRLVLFVHTGFILTGIMTTLLGPLLPTLAARWFLNDVRSGYLFLAQFTGSFVGAILCGRWISSRGFRFCFVTAFGLIALGAGCLVQKTWITGLISVLIYGTGIGFSVGATNLWVGQANPSRRASALSLVNCSWALGAVASPALVALGDYLREITLLVAAFTAAAALLALAFGTSTFKATSESAKTVSTPLTLSFSGIVRDRFAFVFALIFFLDVGTESSLSGWLATYVRRVQPAHTNAWALTPSFFWMGLLLVRLILPDVLRVVPELRLFRVGLALSGIGCCAVLGASGFFTVAVACAIGGIGMAGVFPIAMAWLSEYSGVTNYSLGGVVLALGGLGGGVLPWLVGLTSTALGGLRAGLVVPLLGVVLIFSLSVFPAVTLPGRCGPKRVAARI